MKKTSSKSRPLSLKRETVRVLAASQLESAQGGGFTNLTIVLSDNATVCGSCLINPQLPPDTLSGRNGGCGTITTTTTSLINP
jgi:hypothetical protein